MNDAGYDEYARRRKSEGSSSVLTLKENSRVENVTFDGSLVPPGVACAGIAPPPDPLPLDAGESILEEAHRLTHGNRNADYGHPLDDYARTAALASALLGHKLKDPLTAHEMALVMCCVKLSREMHRPKRDNRTDLAGYAWVADRVLAEQERRANQSSQPK